jgi:hypothetical protein
MARHYNVKLFKIASIHNRVRTDTVLGMTADLPEIGKEFRMTGPGLKFGMRLVLTTPVIAAARLDDSFLFRTRNSTYALLVIDEFDDEAPTSSTGGR